MTFLSGQTTTAQKFVKGSDPLALCNVKRVDENIDFRLKDERVLLRRAVKIVHVVSHEPGVHYSEGRQSTNVQVIMRSAHHRSLWLRIRE